MRKDLLSYFILILVNFILILINLNSIFVNLNMLLRGFVYSLNSLEMKFQAVFLCPFSMSFPLFYYFFQFYHTINAS